MSWNIPHYDSHAFDGRRAHAVTCESGISFEDFGRMHVENTVVKRERRLETPAWAVGNALREVVASYLERRLYLPPSNAPLPERLNAIQRKAESMAAERFTRLVYLREYATLVKEPDGKEKAKRLRDLERQITNLDTDIALTKRGLAGVIVSIAYLFHRCAWDGAQIAEHLGLKQMHVGQILYRLNRAATTKTIYKTREERLKAANAYKRAASRAQKLGISMAELRRRERISANRKGKCLGNRFSAKPRSPEVRATISARLKGNKHAVGHRGRNRKASPISDAGRVQ